jgi:hypothetical protein
MRERREEWRGGKDKEGKRAGGREAYCSANA